MEIKDIKHFKGVPQEQLKAKVTELRKKHHPDKFHESKRVLQNSIMAEINSEYDYLCKNKQTIAAPVVAGKFNQYAKEEELKKQAATIFNALTQKNIDYNSLINIVNKVKDWKTLFSIYAKSYGKSMTFHIISQVKDKKKRELIIDAMTVLSSKNKNQEVFGIGMNILKNIFKL